MSKITIVFLMLVIIASFCIGCGAPKPPAGDFDAYVEEMDMAEEIEEVASMLEELEDPEEEEYERILREAVSEGIENEEVY